MVGHLSVVGRGLGLPDWGEPDWGGLGRVGLEHAGLGRAGLGLTAPSLGMPPARSIVSPRAGAISSLLQGDPGPVPRVYYF